MRVHAFDGKRSCFLDNSIDQRLASHNRSPDISGQQFEATRHVHCVSNNRKFEAIAVSNVAKDDRTEV